MILTVKVSVIKSKLIFCGSKEIILVLISAIHIDTQTWRSTKVRPTQDSPQTETGFVDHVSLLQFYVYSEFIKILTYIFSILAF